MQAWGFDDGVLAIATSRPNRFLEADGIPVIYVPGELDSDVNFLLVCCLMSRVDV